MNSKRGLQLIVLFILSITILGMQVEEVSAQCADNQITCTQGCFSPGSVNSAIDCYVATNQTVYANSADITVAFNWTFKTLIVNENTYIRFVNSQAPKALTGGAGTTGSGDGDGGLGGSGGIGLLLAGSGGKGGHGGEQNNDGGYKGGGGGGGGAGAQLFYKGGNGGNGGDGKDPGGAGGAGGSALFAGANIILILDSITLEENSNISVSGSDGFNGSKGGTNNKGGGGGGGAGGSAAGRLELRIHSNNINFQQGALLVANGGNGGNGGEGGDDNSGSDNKGGGGGGTGGGGNPGEIVFRTPNPFAFDMYVQAKPGLAGLNVGIGEDAGENGARGTDSTATGSLGSQTTETKPNNEPEEQYANCNDEVDNDFDGAYDMTDSDCYTASVWDASIWTIINPIENQNGYNGSARNGTDLACGDDIGNCLIKPNSGLFYSGCINNDSAIDETLCVTITEFDQNYGLYYAGCSADSPIYCIQETSGHDTYCVFDESWNCNSFNEVNCYQNSPYCIAEMDGNYNCEEFASADACAQASSYCDWVVPAMGTYDLGSIISNNDYLCLDSWDDTISQVGIPGYSYAWFGADGIVPDKNYDFNSYQIFQAENTQYISNRDKWFWCDTENFNYGANAISEYDTFDPRVGENQFECSTTLFEALNSENEAAYIDDCTDFSSEYACVSACAQDTDCLGYCFTQEGQEIIVSGYTLGKFEQDCNNACFIKDENDELVNLGSIFSSIKVAFCYYNPYDSACTFDVYQTFNTGVDGYKDQDFCDEFPELCNGNDLNSDLSCSGIYSALNMPYLGDDTKVCSTTPGSIEFCANGAMYPSTNSQGEEVPCCVGVNSYCSVYDAQECSDVGGITNSCGDACVCTGFTLSEDCCLNGNWMNPSQVNLGTQDAFICYAQGENSYISECCGVEGCYNAGEYSNPLNLYKKSVVAFEGVPLHNLEEGFDTDTAPLQRRVFTMNAISHNSEKIFSISSGEFMNWSEFTYLEFDFLYNNLGADYYLILESETGSSCTLSILDHIDSEEGTSVWKHIRIPTNDGSCEIFLQGNVVTISVNSTNSANVAFDNFFLRSSINGENSANRFCSGSWGDWVENLDGDTNNGFYNIENPEFAVYGPYQDACNGVISYGWTGTVCCGDDTIKNKNGEFWVDSNGACWKGSEVKENQVVAKAIGISNVHPKWNTKYGNDTRALLYFESKLWSCNRSLDSYNDYFVSFDGSQKIESFKNSINPTIQDLYTIKGDWICESEGWIKISEFNRIKPIASVLKEIGEEKATYNDGYTLMCGNYSVMSNYIVPLLPENNGNPKAYEMTSYACVLKVGDNNLYVNRDNEPDFGAGFVVIGLVINNITQTFTEYNNLVLSNYKVMDLTDNNCEEASSSVSSQEFFYECAVDNANDFALYYNKPLNLILISGANKPLTNIEGIKGNEGFVQFIKEFWNKFKAFFANLFGADEGEPRKLYDFDRLITNEFYLSVQKDRTIIGSVQVALDGGYNIRVEYQNFTSSVKILQDAIQSNYPNSASIYESNGFKQAIFVNTSQGTTREDWRLITSILRIDIPANMPPTEFEVYYPRGAKVACQYSKVSKHTELNEWVTDPDGVSGSTFCEANKILNYCKKFYPDTTKVEQAEIETIKNWCEAGNKNCIYTYTVQTYACLE